MRVFSVFFRMAFGVALLAARSAWAQAVEEQPLGPDGDTVGGMFGPHGNHVATLAIKGSRFVVLIDGVEGPRIEGLRNGINGGAYGAGSSWQGQIPVLFSNDGSHNAYIAKMGDEFVVFEDGKELSRGPLLANGNGNIIVPLEFSAGGKHLFYQDVDATNRFRIVVDGKPNPSSGIPTQLVVSPDGEHYAYTGFEHSNLGNGTPTWAVVDGRQVNFIGDSLEYTGRNVLVSRMSADGAQVLVFNGKPSIKAVGLNPMWISPDGLQIGIVIKPNQQNPSFLSVNGKTVPGTQGLTVNSMYFSPDGKRYAALCSRPTGTSFMIIDGKMGEEYQTIPHDLPWNDQGHYLFGTADVVTTAATTQRPVPGFTADSSKFVYVAQQGGRAFLVIEDQESSGYQQTQVRPTLSQTGNRIGWIATAPNNVQHVIVDGKDLTIQGAANKRVAVLTFSPGGAHFAYIDGQSIALDGVDQPGLTYNGYYVFSPDGNHLAYLATVGGQSCVVVDGKVVGANLFNVPYTFFSPDSQHIISVCMGNVPGTRDSYKLFVDGKMVTHFAPDGGTLAPVYEFGADGALTFVSRTDGNFRRFRVTMPPGNLDALLASCKAATN